MQLPARRGVCLFTGNKYGEEVLARCISLYVRPVLCIVLCLFAYAVGHNGSFSLLSFILIQVEDDDCLRLNVASRIELNLDIYSTVAGSKSRLPVCMAPKYEDNHYPRVCLADGRLGGRGELHNRRRIVGALS